MVAVTLQGESHIMTHHHFLGTRRQISVWKKLRKLCILVESLINTCRTSVGVLHACVTENKMPGDLYDKFLLSIIALFSVMNFRTQ